MSTTITSNLPDKSEFQIFDEYDEKQIVQAESVVKQALAYRDRKSGKMVLSFSGIKWIILKMSQNGQPIEIVGDVKVELVKHDPDDETKWIWYSTLKMKNQKTKLDSLGASQSRYIDPYSGEFDIFGRTKAISKAERNAQRKQIPEIELNNLLSKVKDADVQTVETSNKKTNNTTICHTCTCTGEKKLASDGKSCVSCGKPFSETMLRFIKTHAVEQSGGKQ